MVARWWLSYFEFYKKVRAGGWASEKTDSDTNKEKQT
jgi:hypothetical protein